MTTELSIPKPWYERFPLHSNASYATKAFLVYTEKTPDVGQINYLFRIHGRTTTRGDKFVQAMRTELSRLRKKLIKDKIAYRKFSMLKIDISQICDAQNNLLPKPQLLVTIARSSDSGSQYRFFDHGHLAALISPNRVQSKSHLQLIKSLSKQTNVEIDCTNWEQIVSAVWAIQNNYAVFKEQTENKFIIGRY